MFIRRLVGPTLITLMASVLWVDYVFFRESSWSINNFLAKIFAILLRIFGPLFDPALFWWVDEIVLPAAMSVLAVVSLYMSVARATVAMSQATPKLDELQPLSARPSTSDTAEMNGEAAAIEAMRRNYAPMDPAGLESRLPGAPTSRLPQTIEPASPSSKPWKFGLAAKLVASFAVVAGLFCAIVIMVAYPRVKALLEHELKRGTGVSVVALGEVAERYNAERDEQALRSVVAHHASNSSIAYVYVEDAEGTIVAHTPRELLTFLRRDFPRTGERALNGIEVEYRDEPVYETAARVGDSRPGYVHLAVWRHAIEAEAREEVASIVTTILAVLCVAIVIAAGAVRFVMLPLSKLVESAQRISNGEFDVDIEIKGNEQVEKNDEVSSLAHSLVRMRTSLRAVMIRLGKLGPHERAERL